VPLDEIDQPTPEAIRFRERLVGPETLGSIEISVGSESVSGVSRIEEFRGQVRETSGLGRAQWPGFLGFSQRMSRLVSAFSKPLTDLYNPSASAHAHSLSV